MARNDVPMTKVPKVSRYQLAFLSFKSAIRLNAGNGKNLPIDQPSGTTIASQKNLVFRADFQGSRQ
jgi:hypothetical protein